MRQVIFNNGNFYFLDGDYNQKPIEYIETLEGPLEIKVNLTEIKDDIHRHNTMLNSGWIYTEDGLYMGKPLNKFEPPEDKIGSINAPNRSYTSQWDLRKALCDNIKFNYIRLLKKERESSIEIPDSFEVLLVNKTPSKEKIEKILKNEEGIITLKVTIYSTDSWQTNFILCNYFNKAV